VCFARENDVTLFKAEAAGAYYCPKCSFTGSAQEVQAMYADLRKKYRWITKRLTLDELRQL
jgi:hypothetical protein